MPAFLTPDGKTRIVVDRVITLGGGRQVCELQGQFFSMSGKFLEDMAIAESLPEPYRARAIKFVKGYREAKVKELAVEPVSEPETVPVHMMSPELQRVLDIRTSEERMQEGESG
jgi:hypothetical protein